VRSGKRAAAVVLSTGRKTVLQRYYHETSPLAASSHRQCAALSGVTFAGFVGKREEWRSSSVHELVELQA
jgi:hypothetical protein